MDPMGKKLRKICCGFFSLKLTEKSLKIVGRWGCEIFSETSFNDFAHRAPGKVPQTPQRKEFLHKLLVKHPGYLPGVCGWDLRKLSFQFSLNISHAYNTPGRNIASEDKNARQLSFSGSMSVVGSEFFCFGDQYFAFLGVVQPLGLKINKNNIVKSNSKARMKKKHGLKPTPTIPPSFWLSAKQWRPFKTVGVFRFPIGPIQCALQFHH